MKSSPITLLDLLQGYFYSDLDVAILKGCLAGKTYEDIAFDLDYSETHIQDKASDLFRFLSAKYSIPVKKKTIKSLFCYVSSEQDKIDYNDVSHRLARIESQLDRLSLLLTELLVTHHC